MKTESPMTSMCMLEEAAGRYACDHPSSDQDEPGFTTAEMHEYARACVAQVIESHQALIQLVHQALVIAEAGLADIGDADREPGDDLAWCEARAAQALGLPRMAIKALEAAATQSYVM